MIELEELIKPITAEQPVGVDLREDMSSSSLYYQVKDARNLARQIERNMQIEEHTDKTEKPRWDTVLQLCEDILINHSKDLEIAVWMLEALIRENNFAGLRTGFDLLYHLIDKYWDEIYPLPDEDGLQTRIMPLISLNGEDYDGILVLPINNIKITQGTSTEPFAFWQYKQALANEKITDAKIKAKKVDQGEAFLEHISKAVTESTEAFYANLWQELHDSMQSLTKLNTILDEKCGNSAPSVTKIMSMLESFADHINFILEDAPFKLNKQQDVAAVESGEAKPVDVENQELAIVANANKTGNIILESDFVSRNQAFQQLDQLIRFFKTSEPYSPVSYILERAKTWGSIPFPELLKELIKDENACDKAFELAGLK
jgi:type VI secretion system protein ImpA